MFTLQPVDSPQTTRIYPSARAVYMDMTKPRPCRHEWRTTYDPTNMHCVRCDRLSKVPPKFDLSRTTT